MSLDFTSIPDRAGVAIYCLHNGTITQERRLQELAATLQATIPHQIFVVSVREPDGEKICAFYSLLSTSCPHIILVNDDDEIIAAWSGGEIPNADVIAYSARTASES